MRFAIAICSIDAFSDGSFWPFANVDLGTPVAPRAAAVGRR
jgi:hypothetical protein